MPDKYDPYREALVMETDTEWSDELGDVPLADRAGIALALHSAPDQAAHLEYIRTHTGFCRRIVVTPADIERIAT